MTRYSKDDCSSCAEYAKEVGRLEAEIIEIKRTWTPNSKFVWQKRWGMIPSKALEHISRLEAELNKLKRLRKKNGN